MTPRSRPVGIGRRQLAFYPLAWVFGVLAPGRGQAGPVKLHSPTSMQAELAAAVKGNRALVLMVSLEGCPFCRVVRDSYLGPLHNETGQPVVQLDMGSTVAVRDFQGVLTTQGALVRSLGVKVAPTLLFFGKGGREVAERLVGASIPDFYGSYLEQRLRDAKRAMT